MRAYEVVPINSSIIVYSVEGLDLETWIDVLPNVAPPKPMPLLDAEIVAQWSVEWKIPFDQVPIQTSEEFAGLMMMSETASEDIRDQELPPSVERYRPPLFLEPPAYTMFALTGSTAIFENEPTLVRPTIRQVEPPS